jgi:Tfp pilus assembly protein PilE
MLNIFAFVAVLVIICLWIWEAYGHSVTMAERDDAEDALYVLRLTLDRYRAEKIEAQAIADHAINVIAEARDITTQTVHEARIRELERAFVDRRQREKDLQDEIEKLTGGNV